MAEVLIVGAHNYAGGREHALADAIAESPTRPDDIWFTPGNAGIGQIEGASMVDIDPADHEGLIAFARKRVKHDLTVIIGSEVPLIAGLADKLRAHDIAVFGPSAQHAQLEGSTTAAAQFMQAHNISHPTALAVRRPSEVPLIMEPLGNTITDWVMRTDGPSGGKGVARARTMAEAEAIAEAMFAGTIYGRGGKTGFVLQQRIVGPEVSSFTIGDGKKYLPPVAVRKYKSLGSHGAGPHTGGMGAFATMPKNVLSFSQWQGLDRITDKVLRGVSGYLGALSIGTILDESMPGRPPKVVELNVRFGDPGAQVVLPLLTHNGVDVHQLLYATARGNLRPSMVPKNLGGAAVAVCLATADYPNSRRSGALIHGLDETYPNVTAYHANTKRDGRDRVRATGGRALHVVGFGSDVKQARAAAYATIGPDAIHFTGMQYRDDIAA